MQKLGDLRKQGIGYVMNTDTGEIHYLPRVKVGEGKCQVGEGIHSGAIVPVLHKDGTPYTGRPSRAFNRIRAASLIGELYTMGEEANLHQVRTPEADGCMHCLSRYSKTNWIPENNEKGRVDVVV